MDTLLDGPRMHEGMAAFWPTADDDPESSPQMVGYAQLARPMPKLVFSNTPEHAGCSTTVVAGDRLADTVAELRARPLPAPPRGRPGAVADGMDAARADPMRTEPLQRPLRSLGRRRHLEPPTP